MLNWLKIQNFAIVSELDLDCPDKMSAFTGETGAGKSIMIDAIDLLLGARADAKVVRTPADKCDLSALFSYEDNSPIAYWLIENDFQQEPHEVLIRRIITKEGRSKYSINGHACTALQIKTLGQMLVHIHGQHEQQSLLLHQNHREHLDHFSHAQLLKQNVKTAYQTYIHLQQQLEEITKENQSLEQVQLWQYQLNELEELQPKEGELEALYQEHHLQHHAKQYLETLYTVENQLTEHDEFAILKQLHHVAQLLHQLPKDNPTIQNALQLLDSAQIELEECLNEIRDYQKQVQVDQPRLARVEERMSRWHQLARKFHIEAEQLPQYAMKLQAKIDRILSHEKEKNALIEALENTKQTYAKAAQALSTHRREYAPELAIAIEQIIHELGMPHAKLLVDIQTHGDIHPHGIDKVEYLIATNPGLPPAPLARIASGGELSRISLSIHLITAQRGATPTLLFDEVDVGIGGATAMKVGQRLRELGERLQIFCVTHQPQVASCAHHQFLVRKFSKEQETFSSIEYLNQDGRIQEVARMLGGLSITEQTRNNAKELLNSIN